MKTVSSLALVALSASALSHAGCGEPGPRLVPVYGTVILNDKPLAGAEIAFVPDPSNKDVTPGGDKSGPDGKYQATFNGRTGIAPGKYKVLISKKADLPEGVKLPEEMKIDRVQQEMMGLRKETLPAKYADATNSEFVIDVGDAGGPFNFDLKVSSKAATAKK